ncbi:MAG: hydrogenase maturation nickel metallochaperone HypA [Candidatus Goldiibacteriota bacterium]
MHEISIAEEIKHIVFEKMKEQKMNKIYSVSLVFGEMTSVVPDALRFAFESVFSETPAEGAEIKIEMVKIKALCPECGKKSELKEFEFICPHCAGMKLEIIQGNEMIVKSIDMG